MVVAVLRVVLIIAIVFFLACVVISAVTKGRGGR